MNSASTPKETQPIEPRYFHTWTMAHFSQLMPKFEASVQPEPLLPAGAPLDYVPNAGVRGWRAESVGLTASAPEPAPSGRSTARR